MELDSYARALGAAQSLVPSYEQMRLQGVQLQGAQLENQIRQRQIGEFDQPLAQQQRLLTDLQGLGSSPTPQAYRNFALRYPSLAKGLNDTASALEENQRQQVVRDTSQMHAAIQAKKPELAAAIVQRHIDAAKRSGVDPDPEDVAMLGMLNSGDPAQLKAASGMLYATLTSFDPDSAAKNIGEYGGGTEDKRYVVGRALVDQAGKALYRDPDPAQEVPVYDDTGTRVGTRFVNAARGGDPASVGTGGAGSSPAGGRRSMGWTPSERDGGDNPHGIVTAKVANVAGAIGVDPDAPLKGSQLPAVFDQIARTEGGQGDLNYRNNNPGNIRDGAFARSQPGYAGKGEGGYAKFRSMDAGRSAGVSLLQRYMARGQRTVRDIIMGKPAGGEQQASSDGSYIGPVASNRRTGRMTPEEVSAEGLDPSVVYYRNKEGVPVAVSGQGNKQGDAKTEASLRKEFDGLPEVKTFKSMRPQFMTLQTLATKPNPTAQDDIALIFSFMKSLDPASVVREGEFATAQNAGSVPQSILNMYNRARDGTRLSASQRKYMLRTAGAAYKQARSAYNTTAQNYRSYANDGGANPDRVARTYTDDSPRAGGGVVRRVRTVQEAMALPAGTIFIDPRGVRRRR